MPMIVRFGYGNVHAGYKPHTGKVNGKDWEARIPAQVALIVGMNVDVFFATELHEENNMCQLLFDAMPAGWGLLKGKGGNHALYRTATIAPGAVATTSSAGRQMSRFTFKHLATAKNFYLGGCHFRADDHSPSKSRNKERKAEARAAVKFMDGKTPGVIAGDFNSATSSKGYPRDILKAGGWLGLRKRAASVKNAAYNTRANKKGGSWIEDIMTRSTAKVTNAELVRTNGASDHSGWLRADLDLDPAAIVIATGEPEIPVEKASFFSEIDAPDLNPDPFRKPPSGYQSLSIEVWRTKVPYTPSADADGTVPPDDQDLDDGPTDPPGLPYFERCGVIAAPSAVSGSIVVNAPGSCSFTVDSDHPRVADLTADGARAVVLYRYAPGSPARPILSGTVAELTGSGPTVSATRTFKIADDWAILNEILGLPAPAKDLAHQGDDATGYFAVQGDAETVFKEVLSLNAARQNVALTVPTSLQRGGNCTVTLRMHPLADRLFPALDDAGLITRILQVGATRYALASEPKARLRTLTEASGVVQSGEFTLKAPKVTRVIVGSGGTGSARLFQEYVDEDLEADFGVSRAAFVDAQEVATDNVSLDDALLAKAHEALAAGGPTVSLKVVLSETEEFRFGKAYELGDYVFVQLSGMDEPLSDQIREIQFDYTPTDGLVLTPLVGDWADATNAELYQSVSVLARSARDAVRR